MQPEIWVAAVFSQTKQQVKFGCLNAVTVRPEHHTDAMPFSSVKRTLPTVNKKSRTIKLAGMISLSYVFA